MNKVEIEHSIKQLNLFVKIFTLCFLCLLGATFNINVLLSNGLKMPVYSQTLNYNSDTHFTYNDTSKINYPFFSDWIHVGNSYYSIGDIIMFISLSATIFYVVKLNYVNFKYKKKNDKKK